MKSKAEPTNLYLTLKSGNMQWGNHNRFWLTADEFADVSQNQKQIEDKGKNVFFIYITQEKVSFWESINSWQELKW